MLMVISFGISIKKGLELHGNRVLGLVFLLIVPYKDAAKNTKKASF